MESDHKLRALALIAYALVGAAASWKGDGLPALLGGAIVVWLVMPSKWG